LCYGRSDIVVLLHILVHGDQEFWLMPITDSGPWRSRILAQADHGFWRKPIANSGHVDQWPAEGEQPGNNAG
jgi:hypothetical protein